MNDAVELPPLPELRLGAELGRGEHAVVLEAWVADGRPANAAPAPARWALKRLLPERRGEPLATRALEHEARLLCALDGRGWPRLLGFGRGDAGPQSALELLPGPNLDAWLETDAGDERAACEGLIDLAEALAELHALGHCHGDVKPGNARRNARGAWTLLDLGFARPSGSEAVGPDARAHDTGDPNAQAHDAPLPGTLAYLSPERLRGGPPSAAADVYALGLVLYEWIVGRHPIGLHGLGPEAYLSRAARTQLPLPSRSRPRVAPVLDEAFEWACAREPEARPSARELAALLRTGYDHPRLLQDASERTAERSEASRRVGQAAAFESLQRAYEACLDPATGGAAVLLTGPPGSGKSRLAESFARKARREWRPGRPFGTSASAFTGDGPERPPLFIATRCDDARESRPFGSALELALRYLGVRRGEPVGVDARAELERLIAPEHAETLLDALDTESSEALQGSVPLALGAFFQALCRERPVIVSVDDLQHARRATLDSLTHLVEALDGSRGLLLLGLDPEAEPSRPEPLERFLRRLRRQAEHEGVRGTDHFDEVRLEPLSEGDVLEWVRQRFHHSTPRLRLAKVLWQRSRGNPGLLEELLEQLADREAVSAHPEDGKWLVQVAPESLPLPASLAETIRERHAALDPQLRSWLQRFSVVGGLLRPEFLQRAFAPDDPEAVREALARLVERGWLEPGTRRFRFARPALRDAVYRSIDPSRRRRLHRMAAAALEAASHDLDQAYQRAFHLRAAREHAALVEELEPLIERAQHRGSPQRVLRLARWGLEALDAEPGLGQHRRLEITFLEPGVMAADRLGEREQERRWLDRLAEIDLDPEDQPALTARIYLLHARYAETTGQSAFALSLLEQAAKCAERGGEAVLESESLRRQGRVLASVGQLETANERARLALERAPDAETLARSELVLALIAGLEDRLEDGLAHLDSAQARCRRAGLRPPDVLAVLHLVRARLLRSCGRTERALASARHSVEMCRRSGERRFQAEATARYGGLLLDNGRPDEAEAQLREALLLAEQFEDQRAKAIGGYALGVLLLEDADPEAYSLLSKALSHARDVSFFRAQASILAVLARAHLWDGRVELARDLSGEAVELLHTHGAEWIDALVLLSTRALILERTGGQPGPIDRELQARRRAVLRRMRDPRLRASTERYADQLTLAARSAEGTIYPRTADGDD
ncbi:MAG: serine/threonine-protein kinase [Planctomycetota bacterium]